MKQKSMTAQRKASVIALALFSTTYVGVGTAYAMPTGGDVKSGAATVTSDAAQMNVNQSTDKVAIDWQSFDIAKGETVNFNQPGKSSIALNRVVGSDAKASNIQGNLNANGRVFLINQNGVLFGQGAQVNVGGLVASTKDISAQDFAAGKYNFAGASDKSVINEGTIKAEGGVVALLANHVENNGRIATNYGTTALAAGNDFSIDFEGDGKINLAVNSSATNAKILNAGTIQANGGVILMTARDASNMVNTVINNTGVAEAHSMKEVNGEIILDGGEQGVVSVGGSLDASGSNAGESGGTIKINGATTNVQSDASLNASGVKAGGLVETSGDVLNVSSKAKIDASSANGEAGQWLLDPLNVVIGTQDGAALADADGSNTSSNTYTQEDTTGNCVSQPTAANTNKTSYVSAQQVVDMLNKGTNVSIEAQDVNKVSSIIVDSAIDKTSGTDAALTLKAQRDVIVNKDITSSAGKLDVNLNADSDGDAMGAVVVNANVNTNGGSFNAGSGKNLSDGTVGTYFGAGASSIATKGGDINLYGDVAIGTGSVLTLDTQAADKAGNVKVTGNVDSGNAYTVVEENNLTWEEAKAAAQGKTGGAKAVGDTYLATITSALENSVANANASGKSEELFVGGVGTETSDRSVGGRSFYWVTGPEGANGTESVTVNGKTYTGTKFYETASDAAYSTEGIAGHTVNGMYANWHTGEPNNHGGNMVETDQDYIAVGYGPSSMWDDVANTEVTDGSVQGYVRELNLENSGLTINAGMGKVDIAGNVGASKALSSLNINNTGDVKIAGSVNIANMAETAGSAAINSTGNVSIGGKVNAADGFTVGTAAQKAASAVFGDKITTGSDTKVYAAGDITTNGVDAGARVLLSSDKGDITLAGGTVQSAAAGDNEAVVIGTNGSFVNKAGADAVKTTGKDSSWKIFSAAPSTDTFGDLDSATNAVWNTAYTDGAAAKEAADNSNRYIFAYQPTVTVKTGDIEKTYGDVITDTTTTYQAEDFSAYKGHAFDESASAVYKEGQTSSDGFAGTARRYGGQYDNDGDGYNEVYDITVTGAKALNGYKLDVENGKLTINQKELLLTPEGEADYGGCYSLGLEADGLVNGDQVYGCLTNCDFKFTQSYKDQIHRYGTTADVGTYKNALRFTGVNKLCYDSIDYKAVNRPGEVTITPATINLSLSKTWTPCRGTKISDNGTYKAGLVNGDTMADVPAASYSYRNGQYGVTIGNTAIDPNGTVVGNYRFTYDGVSNGGCGSYDYGHHDYYGYGYGGCGTGYTYTGCGTGYYGFAIGFGFGFGFGC